LKLPLLFVIHAERVWNRRYEQKYTYKMDDTQTSGSVTNDTRNPALVSLRSRIRQEWDGLSRAERAVTDFLANCTVERLLYASAAELGVETGTSNATVVRTLQRLGYSGLSELKQQVAAPFSSAVAPEVRLRQRIDHLGASFESINSKVWAEAAEMIELGQKSLRVEDVSFAIDLLLRSQQCYAYGVGASSIAADHLVLRLNRIGQTARKISADGFRLADELLPMNSADVVVVFSPGRMITEIDVILARAHDVGAKVILVSDELGEQLASRVAVSLVAPHTPTGISAEALTSMLVSDVLVQGIIAVDRDLAVETSHALTTLRSKLGY
jgi:DNA-binding MurR/RpiR family transcriptional regulator